MRFFYMDDSGNTGKKLDDKQQPLFLLGGIIIKDTEWKKVNQDIINVKEKYQIDEEIHAIDIMNGKSIYENWSLEKKIVFFEELLNVININSLDVFYFKVNKKNFKKYFENKFGKNFYEHISISPYLLSFSYILKIVDLYLETNNDNGILVLDRQDEEKVPIIKTLEILRIIDEKTLKIDNLLETTFFVDSDNSNLIQLADVVAYHLKRYFECEIKNISEKQLLLRKKFFQIIANNIIKEPFDYTNSSILSWLEGYCSGNHQKEKPFG